MKTSWEAVATTAAGVATCHTDLPSMKRLKDWTKGVGGEFLHSAGGRGDSRLWVSMQLEREVGWFFFQCRELRCVQTGLAYESVIHVHVPKQECIWGSRTK